ncbi:MAG: glycosyltransferase family 39 protein [Candidatus Dormiibacterota bacterium]
MQRFAGRGRSVWADPGLQEAGIVLGLLAIGLLIRLPHLSQPLTAISSFRQTETAYPALIYHQQGINLLNPQLPVSGSPWQVPFEFPLFQAMAALVMNLGVATDIALRASGLICFMATAFALWGLVRHLSTRTAAVIALLVFLLSPFNIWWSRSSMIEYMATAFSVAYVWAGMIWIDKRHKRFAALAIVLGTLAMVVKVTSAIFWMVPLLLYWSRGPRPPLRIWLRDRLNVSLVLFLIPLIACVLWTHHADDIKASNPATSWLTSEALFIWNFGTIAQRFSVHAWYDVIHPFDTLVTGLPLWAFAILCGIAWLRERRAVWIGILLAGALPVLVFFNLYVVQQYYLAAVTPAVAAVLGYSLDGVIRYWRPTPVRVVAVLAILASLGSALVAQRDFLAPIYTNHVADPENVLPQAREIDAGTKPQDLIVFDGLTWSPAVPYYARRRGMMLLPIIVTTRLLDALPAQGYTYLYTAPQNVRFSSTARAVLERWAWFGEVSQDLFHLGSSYASVDSAGIAATATPFEPAAGSVSLIPAPKMMSCDGVTTDIAVAIGSTVTMQFATPAAAAHDSLAINGQWIPAASTVVVASGDDRAGSLRLACEGGTALDLDGVYVGSTPS